MLGTFIVLVLIIALYTAAQYAASVALKTNAIGLKFGYGRALTTFSDGPVRHVVALFPLTLRPADAADLTLVSRRRWVLTLLAGPLSCALLSIFSLTLAIYGQPADSDAPIIGTIQPGSPAEAADLRAGDRVLSVNGQAIESWKGMRPIIVSAGEGPVPVTYERAGERREAQVAPKEGRIGIAPSSSPSGLGRAVWSSTRITLLMPLYSTQALLGGGFDQLPTFATADDLPVVRHESSVFTRARLLFGLSVGSWASLLFWLFLLPVPPFDGWHVLRALRRQTKSGAIAQVAAEGS